MTHRRGCLLILCGLSASGLLHGCKSATELEDHFVRTGVPYFSHVAPARGKVGTLINLAGGNFGPSPGEVSFRDDKTGRLFMGTVSSWADAAILASVPPLDNSTGSVKITLKTAAGAKTAFPVTFTLVND